MQIKDGTLFLVRCLCWTVKCYYINILQQRLCHFNSTNKMKCRNTGDEMVKGFTSTLSVNLLLLILAFNISVYNYLLFIHTRQHKTMDAV